MQCKNMNLTMRGTDDKVKAHNKDATGEMAGFRSRIVRNSRLSFAEPGRLFWAVFVGCCFVRWRIRD
jgi:hypothetical protein